MAKPIIRLLAILVCLFGTQSFLTTLDSDVFSPEVIEMGTKICVLDPSSRLIAYAVTFQKVSPALTLLFQDEVSRMNESPEVRLEPFSSRHKQ